MSRNPGLRQHPCIHISPPGETAQQNDNIPAGRRAEGSQAAVPHLLMSQKLPDTGNCPIGLQLPRRPVPGIVHKLRRFHIQQQKLRLAVSGADVEGAGVGAR